VTQNRRNLCDFFYFSFGTSWGRITETLRHDSTCLVVAVVVVGAALLFVHVHIQAI
jgi:hypothetical protein